MKKRKSAKRLAAAVLSGVLLAGTASTPFSMSSVQAEEDTLTTVYSFDFEDGIDGWYYGDGWEYQYNGTVPVVESDTEDGRLRSRSISARMPIRIGATLLPAGGMMRELI